MEPLVSVCCISYNQAPYIRDAMDGFLSQKTSFPIEILVHDDCSEDGTDRILRDYESRFPGVVKVLYETENQYSKGIRNPSGAFNFPRARGKYIAMCEGDDFWCDERKLEKQTAFLEDHPEAAFSAHAAKIRYEDGAFHSGDGLIRPFEGTGMLSAAEVITKKTNLPMASLLFRAEYAKPLPPYYYSCPVGDIPLQLAMLEHGGAYYLDEVMSVYRSGRPGSWGSDMDDGSTAGKWEAHYGAMEALYRSFSERTGGVYGEACDDALRRLRFHTDLKEGKFKEALGSGKRKYFSELPAGERGLLLLRAYAPGLYGALRSLRGSLASGKRAHH